MKRIEQLSVKSAELWTEADHSLFSKYCLNKWDKAYHMVAHDSSCGHDEILGVLLPDLYFKINNAKQYA